VTFQVRKIGSKEAGARRFSDHDLGAQDAPVITGTIVAYICGITCDRQTGQKSKGIPTFSLTAQLLSHGTEKSAVSLQTCVRSSLVVDSWPPWPGVMLHLLNIGSH